MLKSCLLILIYANFLGANGFTVGNRYIKGMSRELQAEAEIIYRMWKEENLVNLSAVEFVLLEPIKLQRS